MKSVDEYESEIGELQLQVEDIELDKSILIGCVFGLLAHIQWHNQWVSLVLGLTACFIQWKLIASKPFSSGIASDDG